MMIKDNFTLRTVRKKIIMVSKIAGIILIISYVISTQLSNDPNISALIWLAFVIPLVLSIDYLMGRLFQILFPNLIRLPIIWRSWIFLRHVQ